MLPTRFTPAFIILFAVLCFPAVAQLPLFTIEGNVYDQSTNTPLPGATVYVSLSGQGSHTDGNGYYKLNLPGGAYTIIYSFVGYASDSVHIDLHHHTVQVVKLRPTGMLMHEITVSDENESVNLTETETGLITLKQKDIENLPYLLGEVDPIRIIQLMPGVHTSGEGNTGFYVRGGAIDQNLMLLDNATIYNPSHLFGFFSVFNGNTINTIDLYKSGIPAYHGGRLSSITKVITRKGSTEQIKGEGSIGLIAANVLVEGPIKKGKGSFLIAARRTYVDLFVKALRNLSILKQDINYFFYDINVNADYRLGNKDLISLRTYAGKDDFTYNNANGFTNNIAWQNKTVSLSWQHLFNTNLFSELSVNTSLYDMDFGAAINQYKFSIVSDIKDINLSYQFNLKKKKHDLTWGLSGTFHTLRPNNINANSEDVSLDVGPSVKLRAAEAAIFLNDKIHLSEQLEVSGGIRISGFSHLGAFTRYIEDDNFQVLDTLYYNSGHRISNDINFEPRLAIRYSINESASLKVSYDRTYQYMHMAPLSSVSLPLDIWVPSSSVIKPQSAHQYSGGYFKHFAKHNIESSIVTYYKTMQNQIEYREGVIIGYSKGFNFDDNFVFGKGTSYGAEFSLHKKSGRINGMFSYTLSRTTRKFDNLNSGKSFPAKYDRLHDLSIMANFIHNPKWTISGVFVYGTGNALNLPIARYVIQGNVVNEYGDRNSFRMPAYHRMDLAVTYNARKTERFESQWIFSVYNVYNRRNPYYIYFETKGNLAEYELKTSLKQVSLFPVLPAITYRIKFQ